MNIVAESPARGKAAEVATPKPLVAHGPMHEIPRQTGTWLTGQGEALEAALNGAPLETSLGVLVRSAVQLLGPDSRAAFYLANPEGTALEHVVGMSAEYAQAVSGFAIGSDSLACGLAVHTGQAAFTADVSQEPRWGPWLWMAEKFGYRACWSIPIHTSARLYAGTLAIYWAEPRAATDRDVEITTLVVQTAAIIISRHQAAESRGRAEAALRRSEEQLQTELEDAKLLQGISAEIVHQNDVDQLFQKLVEAASGIMRADFACMQMLYPERGDCGELLLLGSSGLSPEALQFWKWVRADSQCTCGIALRTRERAIDPDIAHSPLMAGTADQKALLAIGIRASQSTPLISRGGRLLGMISTHWGQPHQPSERDIRLLDVLARQAADVIERKQAQEAKRSQAERLRLLWEAATLMLTADDPDAMLRGLFGKIGAPLGVDAYFNYVVDESGAALRLASCAGIPDDTARDITRLEMGQAICGTAALLRQPIVATHIQQSQDPKAQLIRSFGIRAYACNVLMTDRALLGTLSFASRTKDQFSADELAFLETICQYVTAAYERLRLLKELREADQRKDEFLATLAHELRNPLAPISNAIQILKHQEHGQPDLRRGRQVIERQVGHLTRLVDDLMDVSRVSRNRLELRRQPMDLSQLIVQAVETSRALIDPRNQQLTVSLPPRPIPVEGDEVRLSQVFLNLLGNASKYTQPGGRIWISADQQGSEVVVSVKDNGVGISPDNLPRLFRIFFQIDQSLEKAQSGLGIGLSLVQRLVELHGGRVEARSAGVGQGSEFIVRLPLLVKAAAFSEAVTPTQHIGNGAKPACRLLIVDDNKDAADTLAELARVLGHEAHVAYDGLAGVESSERLKPDVILLDLGMPRLNGYDACRRIREQSWSRDAAVISLTGWGQDCDRLRSVEAGFDEHLVKPVAIGTLTKVLAGRGRAAKQPARVPLTV